MKPADRAKYTMDLTGGFHQWLVSVSGRTGGGGPGRGGGRLKQTSKRVKGEGGQGHLCNIGLSNVVSGRQDRWCCEG